MSNFSPLSHSSANLLLSCEQKYYHHKIARTSADPDYEDGDALVVGKAFHHVLEVTNHKKPKSIRDHLEKYEPLPDHYYNLVHAMLIKAYRIQKLIGLEVVACEVELATEQFLGYVDAIMKEKNGNWWIVDFKTAATFNYNTANLLHRDPQMSLYAFYRHLLAEIVGLDPDKFQGTRWRVVTKSKAKQRGDESDADFVKRLVDKSIKAFDIPIPYNMEAVAERGFLHSRLVTRAKKLADGDATPIKNYGNCFAYFKPCKFFSQCHGQTFSEIESPDIVEI